ncbi:MAG: hypothetical protein R6V01_08375 [Thermoplasmatota archaeon]
MIARKRELEPMIDDAIEKVDPDITGIRYSRPWNARSLEKASPKKYPLKIQPLPYTHSRMFGSLRATVPRDQ